ncbi:hypothetical protein NCAS_0J00440 [Naumovozyma castellii]|uniref:Uncharacterized protein n=1 Tax=Naumovozyma castellii TaxID=27288 RepID=G0VKI8_NAUCA|nr:hypothetical protein NCAS_0J00440 [Naumovozyma castellii CBS 4309]CCC72023.1 hypothetical protein NCAS_0J00440 [Naumovozyma castellii CBS 4309]
MENANNRQSPLRKADATTGGSKSTAGTMVQDTQIDWQKQWLIQNKELQHVKELNKFLELEHKVQSEP